MIFEHKYFCHCQDRSFDILGRAIFVIVNLLIRLSELNSCWIYFWGSLLTDWGDNLDCTALVTKIILLNFK